MIEISNKEKCSGCHACYNVCPVNAITMIEDERGFKYPKVNKDKCINCSLCEKVCPIVLNRQKDKDKNKKHQAYAVNNKNNEIRKNSSSGGAFNLIANYILDNDGVVFGASFNSQWQVEHIEINNKENLIKLQTSKYTQSIIGKTYKKAKQYLDEGRLVLFTGTPCQVEGLQTYLQKDYNNLYTQDIICHGVPSPKVWRKYLEFREKQDGQPPVRINFRQKDEGWNLYSLLLKYNSSEYKMNHSDDLFYKAFLQNACLRDSCYNCSFKKWDRFSDITIGDFWGMDNIAPEMNDNKGTSLVIINSEKGKKIFDNVKLNSVYQEVDINEAIKGNPSFVKSVKKNKNTDNFFENLDYIEFNKLVKKYVPNKNIFVRVIYKVKNKIRKIIKKRERSKIL